ncbi:MAG: glycosyltransferase, partial [Phototrophicales bacterium]
MGLNPDGRVLLFFGAIRNYKGVPDLVTVFDEVAGDRDELVIAGRVYDRGLVDGIRLQTRAKKIHLHDRFVPDEEIQLFLNACDLVV